jgi:hypothetical protein
MFFSMGSVKIKLPLPLVAGVLLAAYYTKPQDESFPNYFQTWITTEVKRARKIEREDEVTIFGVDSGWIGDASASFITSVMSKFSRHKISDYYVFKLASISARGKKYYFVGAFSHWFGFGASLSGLLDNLQST